MNANSRIKIVSGPYKGAYGTVLHTERVNGAMIVAMIVKIDNEDLGKDDSTLIWPWEAEVIA